MSALKSTCVHCGEPMVEVESPLDNVATPHVNGIQPETYVPPPKPPAPVKNSGIGTSLITDAAIHDEALAVPITEAQIVDRFASLSSLAVRRIADAAELVIEGRAEDGVFE